MDAECIHGLTVRTCDFCLGALRKRNYRDALEEVMPEFIMTTPVKQTKQQHLCELCPCRGANKYNRITVKLPRGPRKAWGKDIPPYPSTFMGPTLQAPRVYKATHRNKRGHWACDRCDPSWAAKQPLVRYIAKDRTNLRAQTIWEA